MGLHENGPRGPYRFSLGLGLVCYWYLVGRPFLRNDMPDIYFGKFPLHHPGYSLA